MTIVAGIDCGADTTKVAVWSETSGFRTGPLLPNNGRVGEIVARALNQALQTASLEGKITYIVATGSMAPKVTQANSQAPESVCLARGIDKFLPGVITAIDAGAAKVLVIKQKNGVPLAVAHSDRCAGGSGSFLIVAADVLGVPVAEMGNIALLSKEEVSVQSTCAVFAESEIISLIHSGKTKEDIANGMALSCAHRIFPLLNSVRWEKEVAIFGGTAKNAALVKALEKLIGTNILVPVNSDFYPALGAALIAKERAADG